MHAVDHHFQTMYLMLSRIVAAMARVVVFCLASIANIGPWVDNRIRKSPNTAGLL